MSTIEFERFVIAIYGTLQKLPVQERIAILDEVVRRMVQYGVDLNAKF